MISRRLIIGLVPFIADFAIAAAWIGIPLYALDMGADILTLGLIGSVNGISYTAAALLSGRMGKVVSRTKLLSITPAISGVLLAAMPACTTPWRLIVLSGAVCISQGFFWPRFEAWIAEERTAVQLARDLGLFNLSWCGGLSLGGLGGGILYGLGPQAVFWATAGAMLLIALLVGASRRQFARAETGSQPPVEPVPSEPTNPDAHAFLLIGWTAIFTGWAGIGILRSLLPKLATDLHFSAFMIGIMFGVMSFVQAVMFFLLGATRFWQYRLAPLVAFQLVGMAGFALVILSSNFGVLNLGLALIGCGVAVGYTASLFYSVHGYQDETTKSGWHEAMLGAGALVGPLLGGILAKAWWSRAPYLLGAAVIGLAIIVQILIWAKARRSRGIA